MKLRFSLRAMLAVTAVLCIAITAMMWRTTQSHAFSVEVVDNQRRFHVFLDDHDLGPGTVDLTMEQAWRLGVGRVLDQREVHLNSFGAFLKRFPRPDGSHPRVHLRRPMQGGVAVPISLSSCSCGYGRIVLVPSDRRDSRDVPHLSISLNCIDQAELIASIRLPTELPRAAESNGGVLIAVDAISLRTGERGKQLNLRRLASDAASFDTAVFVPKGWQPGDRLGICVRIEGIDDAPIGGWEDLEKGLIVNYPPESVSVAKP